MNNTDIRRSSAARVSESPRGILRFEIIVNWRLDRFNQVACFQKASGDIGGVEGVVLVARFLGHGSVEQLGHEERWRMLAISTPYLCSRGCQPHLRHICAQQLPRMMQARTALSVMQATMWLQRCRRPEYFRSIPPAATAYTSIVGKFSLGPSGQIVVCRQCLLCPISASESISIHWRGHINSEARVI